MATRRGFLASLAAAGLCPQVGWARAGSPEYLAAGLFPDGIHRLAGLRGDGGVAFAVPLPDRGHAAAAHPARAEAVAFARRPGRFAIILDCFTGTELARLDAPEGRHFYGHGVFSADGTRVFTSENDFDAGAGVIGVWDVNAGYRRVGEFASGGVGPHDVALLPGGQVMVVANGGIETHPDAGRAKLNLPFMEPNLSYLSLDGTLLSQVSLDRALHRNSIRHLAVRSDGLVAFAMQWEGDKSQAPPLLGLHRRTGDLRLLSAPPEVQPVMQGYAGSVAFSGDETQVAITSPRGGALHVFDVETGALSDARDITDVCGLGASAGGLFYTAGTGQIGNLEAGVLSQPDCQWDNHLVALA